MILTVKTLVNNKSVFQAALKSRSTGHTVKHVKNKELFPWLSLLTSKKGSEEPGKHCDGQFRCKQKRV